MPEWNTGHAFAHAASASGMIVSASYRTDIPAFYAGWFLARLAAGYATVRNPYGGADYRVPLDREAVDGFVFWTRNPAPFDAALDAVAVRGTPFVVQVTITGYPQALETSVVDADRIVDVVRRLADRFGPRTIVWRYDPLIATSLTPPAWHRDNFARIAARLEGATDEVVLSWTTIYAKTERNLRRASRNAAFDWDDPPDDDKRALLTDLAAIAADRGMRPTLCSQPDLLADGIAPAKCIDAERLSDIAGYPITAREKGNRPGCPCAESRDIGAYDTCPHGCVYCYAVRDRRAAKQAYGRHYADAERL